ncbi:MAG TPA: IclR family transcriptional regulator C-terminal domain-containing protein [Burkholderiaceae bacterium]|nr:IclR family transcriptional regulator C-terminal domain-containing protein [Burkholderiaceae bacterium]
MSVPADPADIIAGLGRGLAVIECFDDDHARMTPTEVARRIGISRSAARRYLVSLCHFGYAKSDGRTFWLEPRVLRLGQSYLLSARLPRLAQPFLQRLSAASGETASLAVLDGHDVVYLARQGGTRLANAGFQLGARLPAHVVSVGRAILSTWPDADLDAWIREHAFTSFTQFTTLDPPRFRDDIAEARQASYALADQQLELGWRGLAVAQRNRYGECVGAIGVTMPVETLSAEKMVVRFLPLLRAAETDLRGLL